MNHSSPLRILVNIGCGCVYHRAWTNLDFAPVSPDVRVCDLRRGLPFANGSVDAVYHSHVLEHLERKGGRALLSECARVLRSGGVIRVVVPDLEGIARRYLAVIEDPSGVDATRHEWLRLEFVDQFARHVSGGAMAEFLRTIGDKDREKLRPWLAADLACTDGHVPVEKASLFARARRAGWKRIWRHLRIAMAQAGVRLLGGKELATAFEEGVFRASGEVHRHAYDRFALAGELERAGFIDSTVMTADVSRIPGFGEFGLETTEGRVRKPDSLFMEALRR